MTYKNMIEPTIRFVDIDKRPLFKYRGESLARVIESGLIEPEKLEKYQEMRDFYHGDYSPTIWCGLSYDEAMNEPYIRDKASVPEGAIEDTTGIIVTSNLNYNHVLKHAGWEQCVYGFSPLSPFGLSDTISGAYHHVLKAVKEEWEFFERGIRICAYEEEDFRTPEDMFFILLITPIFNDATNDFRPHKWGEYIGNRLEGHEYIRDENIDMLYVFQLLPVRRIA